MNNISLNVTLKNGLELKDPFMIASSHLTDSKKAFEFLAPVSPSAVTTKTISDKYGGNRFTNKPKRVLKQIKSWSDNNIGLYADGPKETELWGISIAYDLLIKAKEILPQTKIGISILQGEDYDKIKSSLGETYDYVELNLKYSLRLSEDKKKNLQNVINEIKDDISSFCKTFENYPKFIKVSREAYSFFTELFIPETLEIIKNNNALVIIANSKKMDGPPSYAQFKNPNTLKKGVIVGDYLFPETYNIIKDFDKLNSEIEVVANGGIMSIGEILDCMTFGVKTFQICTLLHRKGIYVIEMLRRQLKSSIKNLKHKSLEDFSRYILKNPEDLAKIPNLFITKKEISEKIISDGFPIVKEALINEIDKSFSSSIDRNQINYNQIIRFAGTKGSVLSYFVSFYLSQFKNYQISISSSKPLTNSTSFDATLISNAYLSQFNKNNPNYLNTKIGNVKYGLMSITNDLSKIKKVFLFESIGSEEAKIDLLKYHRFKYEYIKPEELAPLLIGWDESLAILAKYPLTNFYKFLLPENVKDDWQEIFSVQKPIWLCTKDIPNLKEKIISDISVLISDLTENVENSLLNLLNLGLNDYLTELLIAKK